MQTAFSLPQNEGFFQRYATLVPVLSKLGIFAQIINGLTEFGIINAIVLAHIIGLFGSFSIPVAILSAIFGVTVLELGQRTFLPYTARAILYRRFSGLDLWMSLFIFCVTLCLFGASLYLSFRGSHDLVESTAPPPVLLNVAAADSIHSVEKNEAEKIYQSEITETNGRYNGLISAVQAATAAQIATHRTQIQQIQAKELRTGQRYTSERNTQTNAIKSLEADEAVKVSALEQEKSKELKQAIIRRNAAADAATGQRSKVDALNDKTVAENTAKINGYGGGLGWVTVIFHLVLALSIVLDEMHKKGSGIELRATPNQYHFSQSIWSLFWNTVSEKWNYLTRHRIQLWANKTPAPDMPKLPHPIYDAPSVSVRRAVSVTPPNEFKEAVKTASSNGQMHTATQNFNTRANVSITIPYNKKRPPYNWDAPLHEPVIPSVNNATVTTDHFNKSCAHCGRPFYAKVNWQKYCQEQCKLDAHEAKHGVRFEPKKYHKKK